MRLQASAVVCLWLLFTLGVAEAPARPLLHQARGLLNHDASVEQDGDSW